MTKQDDGGGTFPCGVMQDGHNPGQEPWQRGLSIQGYFAAAALQGLCAKGVPPSKKPDDTEGWTVGNALADRAYFIADAMLRVRSV